ncbi:MAG: diguanylate cyclase, partial [Planctomycetota bacterium]
IRPSARLAMTVGVTAGMLTWIALGLEIMPNPTKLRLEKRVAIIKAIAHGITTQVDDNKPKRIPHYIQEALELNPNILSIGILRTRNKKYMAEAGPHQELWVASDTPDPRQFLAIDLLSNGRKWGILQLAFEPLHPRFIGFPLTLIMFVSATTTLFSWWMMSRTFKYLNPTRVVPNRVRSALDTLTEGLVLVDPKGNIAHANSSFAKITGMADEGLIGSKLDQFQWESPDGEKHPWTVCLESKQAVTGNILELRLEGKAPRKFAINSTPVMGQNGRVKGVLTSFDDVTELEEKNVELAGMINSLRSSRDEISRQNEKLNFLASYDPLTTCMNRRSFFGEFEEIWSNKAITNLSIIMLDVDHFKSVNDNHGHSVGDEVLKATGRLLKNAVGEAGLVCRYGGEEFVILVPNLSVEECHKMAEDFRKLIESTPAGGINFTASFGMSSKAFGAMDPQHMLDQADECLYSAKRQGRNQVVRFDQKIDLPPEDNPRSTEAEKKQNPPGEPIAYSAVTGLLSALSFRCPETAEHSFRVADLCVGVGRSLMKKSDLYLLEVAALLHDIGKIGVPDRILHKPGQLNEQEWEIMRKHDSIGVEIVRSAFACDAITHAIESHHYCYSRKGLHTEQTLSGLLIPLTARIITVCDAYDAMTNDRVYRKAMPVETAIEELWANAPGQFDPIVVEKLIEFLQSGELKQPSPSWKTSTSSKVAVTIGKHIEEIHAAIAKEDIDRLQMIVEELKQDSKGNQAVQAATKKLNQAIDLGSDDIDEVLQLANEVMTLCRASRSAFVGAASAIIDRPS